VHTSEIIKSSGESICKTPTMVLNQSEISPLTLTALNMSIHILQYPSYFSLFIN